VYDTYSDGICCGYGNGNFSVENASGETLLNNNGNFGSQAEEVFCATGEGCLLAAEILTTDASDENATDGSITINPSNGTEPYEYSIDGAQSFTANNVFDNLAPGTYMIVVKGDSENCIYEETVEIGFDIVSSLSDISVSGIKIFPNPTKGDLAVDIGETFNVPGNVNVEVYNALGLLIETNSISKFDNKSQAVISLKKYASGTYVVKCYNQHFEKHFKVIKL